MSTKKIVNGLPFHSINRTLVVPGTNAGDVVEFSETSDRTRVWVCVLPGGKEEAARGIFLDAEAFSELKDQLGTYYSPLVCIPRETILKEMEEERKYAEAERIRREALATSAAAEPTEK